jgi:hypothetical protein
MNLLRHPADHRHRFAKIRLAMARRMPQRHEHLAPLLPTHPHVILDRRVAAPIPVLVTQPIEDPLRRMPLLGRYRGIVVQKLIDDPGEPVELRPRRRSAPPIAWRHRKAHHLGHGAWVDPKISGRTTLAQPLHINCSPNPRIQIHALHPSAFRPDTGRKAYLDDALLRRRGRTIRPIHVRDFCAAAYTRL